MGFFEDRIAPALLELQGKMANKEFDPIRASLLRHARGRVLEIGAGTGFNIRHYPPEVMEIVLTEPGRGFRERARRRANADGRRIEIVDAAAERLPFEDDSFDTVVSTLVLCSVDDQAAALAEIRRVLKPGGRFLFMEHVRSDDPRLARRQDRWERPWRVIAMGCRPNRATVERIEAAGFALEDVEHCELPKTPPIVRPMVTGRAVAQA